MNRSSKSYLLVKVNKFMIATSIQLLFYRFSSCHDLVLSRFCATDYKEHGIAGLKIHRILRVHNRMLRKRFDDKLTGIVDNTEGEYFPSNR